ncbi:hypothetical protein HYX01_04400 [Candidatus Woesearchaeota archaeon]|nr:hypothetical protein [Candidatus Woesearchaeota archaeon]
MPLLKSKRAEAITIILVTLMIVLFLGWFINFNSKECRSNSQCKKGEYCGSDFSCHSIPIVEKEVKSYNLVLPAFILGIAIVISAWLIKSKNRPFKRDNPKLRYHPEEPQQEQWPLLKAP